ncbi:hypothetical protein [Actinoplanes sp. URMC 104]|uniref:hypothetical protein n=1 Tax=Actinoplanes sp. URMC 104 TaxID=3423409 RepID=UPI003F1BAF08
MSARVIPGPWKNVDGYDKTAAFGYLRALVGQDELARWASVGGLTNGEVHIWRYRHLPTGGLLHLDKLGTAFTVRPRWRKGFDPDFAVEQIPVVEALARAAEQHLPFAGAMPVCSCAAADDIDPDCMRHYGTEPTDAEVLALLPAVRAAQHWEYGYVPGMERGDAQLVNYVRAILREQRRHPDAPYPGTAGGKIAPDAAVPSNGEWKPWVHGSQLGRGHRSLEQHLVEDHGRDADEIAVMSDGAMHGWHDGVHGQTWAYAQDLPHAGGAA